MAPSKIYLGVIFIFWSSVRGVLYAEEDMEVIHKPPNLQGIQFQDGEQEYH